MKDLLNKFGMVVMLPAIIAHELTHAVATYLAGGQIIDYSAYPPRIKSKYPPGTAKWKIRAANVSPTAIGIATIPLLRHRLLYRTLGSVLHSFDG
jgi:hypothetical protein